MLLCMWLVIATIPLCPANRSPDRPPGHGVTTEYKYQHPDRWGLGGSGDWGSQDIIIILGFTDENETCYNHLLFDFILQLTININRWFRRPTMVIVNDSHHGGFFGITEIFCVEHGVQVKGVSLVLDFNHSQTGPNRTNLGQGQPGPTGAIWNLTGPCNGFQIVTFLTKHSKLC